MAQIKCQECGQEFSNELTSCPSCGCPAPKAPQFSSQSIGDPVADTKGLAQNFVPALIQVLHGLLQVILLPFNLWVKAVERLAASRNNHSLSMAHIDTPWPFLSFLKRLLLEFLFDLATFLSYILGPIFAIWRFIDTLSWMRDYNGAFSFALTAFFATLLGCYLLPVLFTIYRDLFQLCLLPLRKFINWCLKPAQTLDLNVKKNDGFIG